jgi:hypothetical protein
MEILTIQALAISSKLPAMHQGEVSHQLETIGPGSRFGIDALIVPPSDPERP